MIFDDSLHIWGVDTCKVVVRYFAVSGVVFAVRGIAVIRHHPFACWIDTDWYPCCGIHSHRRIGSALNRYHSSKPFATQATVPGIEVTVLLVRFFLRASTSALYCQRFDAKASVVAAEIAANLESLLVTEYFELRKQTVPC